MAVCAIRSVRIRAPRYPAGLAGVDGQTPFSAQRVFFRRAWCAQRMLVGD